MLVRWRRSGSRPPALVYRHLTAVVAGLALWVVYLLAERPAVIAWTAFAVIFVGNALGDTLMVRGHRERHGRSGGPGDYGRAVLAIVRRPLPLAHATLAGVTFFSVLLAALGVAT